MSETSLSKRLTLKMRARGLTWDRIENSVETGTPDVFGIGRRWAFWCELKHLHDYPARPTTPIRWKRFTTEQARTIRDYGASGKVGSWILVQVASDHWLFDYTKAEELQREQPLIWWEANAFEVWRGRLDYDQLATIL